MLNGKKILIGVSGSIAAYKIPLLVRQLIKNGAEVQLIMTPAARDFVSSLTLSTLSKKPVLIDLFDEQSWSNHVMLGRWADLMLIAPLSCNTLSKMAHGLCDNLLLATYLSANCPVMVAPAMDEDMWHHPATLANLESLRAHGCEVLPAEYGELASGLTGQGRMAEPEMIYSAIADFLNRTSDLKGKKALVTAGPTFEAIDPVRFVGNHSSGKMGFALAEALRNRGADVTLVSGPVALSAPAGLQYQPVQTAAQMFEACQQHLDYDIAIMAAAVADYTPVTKADQKIKKKADNWSLELTRTPDILASLGQHKKAGQILVGFALETNNEEENALKKLQSKNADVLVLNSLNDQGAGFGTDTNKVTVFFKDGKQQKFALQTKKELAKKIIDTLIHLK